MPWAIENAQQRSYENTLRDWYGLCHAARDAVALSLVPPDILTDARNDEPHLHADSWSYVPRIVVDQGMVFYQPHHNLPSLQPQEVDGQQLKFHVARPFQIEIWAEKTTVNDVLLPLARQSEVNLC